MPIWPYKMKIAVWWISYILLLITGGLLIIRFIVYLFFYIFGVDVWIFPDLNDEKLGFFDSFKRVISWEKRNEKWYTILIRIAIALFTGWIAFCVYKNPKLIDDAKKLIYAPYFKKLGDAKAKCPQPEYSLWKNLRLSPFLINVKRWNETTLRAFKSYLKCFSPKSIKKLISEM